ncbi:MAG: GntR family transcriptional regulator [Chloroflexota bacterium]|jgi:GntR family transcriptional regulator
MSDAILSQIGIDRYSPIPIYLQLEEQLEQLIVNGAWRPKEPLPSDHSLAQTFQISVMTVRQAMSQLVNKGLIYRERGRGTFVSPRLLDHHLTRLEGFTEDMRSRGLSSSSRILTFDISPASSLVTDSLALEAETPVLHIERLRLVDDRPVAIHDAYLTYLDISREELEAVESLYALLERKGVWLTEAYETLEAIAASKDMADLLRVERGAPLLKASRTSWDRSNRPIELVYAIYRADFYRYGIRLRR